MGCVIQETQKAENKKRVLFGVLGIVETQIWVKLKECSGEEKVIKTLVIEQRVIKALLQCC